jgi:type IV pilus assembly protein PilO
MAAMDPQQRQKLMLAVMVLLLVGYGGYEYVYRPRSEEIAVMETRLQALEAQNRAARALSASEGREAVERRLSEYREQLVRVEGLIPSSEELPDLLDAISAEAQRTGVELALIQPVGATAESFYTRRTYDLAVIGSYHEIGEFLTAVGSLPRIVTPISLDVTMKEERGGEEEPELEARFSIETYVLPASDLPNDNANAN